MAEGGGFEPLSPPKGIGPIINRLQAPAGITLRHEASKVLAQAYPPRDNFEQVRKNCSSFRYNGSVANIPPVPEDQFKAVIRALLNTAPLPLADIPRKRGPNHPKAKRHAAKKAAK